MKTLFLLFVITALGVAQSEKAQSEKKTTAKKSKAPATAASGEVKIPEGAVPTDDGSFKYTDAQGKKWIYRNTPFGVARSEDKPPQPVKQTEPDPTVAFEEGDTYRFEKPTPFGTVKWKKKKTDLDDTERKVIERQTTKK